MTEKEYYRKRKKYNLCVRCGQQDAYTMNGRSYCSECAEKKAKVSKKYYENNRETVKASQKKYSDKLKKEHKCPRCSKKLDKNDNHKVCPECRAKIRKYYNEKNRGKSKIYGVICWRCNKNKTVENKALCEECYKWWAEISQKGLKAISIKRENDKRRISGGM